FPIEVITDAEYFDWERGVARVSFSAREIPDFENEFLYVEDTFSELELDLKGMCFLQDVIELLAPGAQLPIDDLLSSHVPPSDPSPRRGGPGRRREYDWEGALFHLVAEAELNSIAPDPGAHGAQADIVRKLADWFALNGGKVPSESQLQAYASRALTAIRTVKV